MLNKKLTYITALPQSTLDFPYKKYRTCFNSSLPVYKILDRITPMAYYLSMEFVETPIFTKLISELISDEEYSAFQKYLCENPESGDIIKGGAGIGEIAKEFAK